jgi:hypothetical protein
VIQVNPGNDRKLQSQPQAQGNPITERFTQFTTTPLERRMAGLDPLKAGDFSPVRAFVLHDLVNSPFHRRINIAGEQNVLLFLRYPSHVVKEFMCTVYHVIHLFLHERRHVSIFLKL